MRVPHQTENPSRTYQCLKMANIVTLIGGDLASTLASTGNSYLFSRLSKDDIARERKRHDLAMDQLQKMQVQ